MPVVLAGGAGRRLWPLSRTRSPKPFHALLDPDGEATLLETTLGRLHGLDAGTPWVVCGEDHRFLTAEALRRCGLEDATILLEPAGRNTAPAIVSAALAVRATMDEAVDPVLLVLSADQWMADAAAFREAIRAAHQAALAGHLVTLGVPATRAETGYGYIEPGDAVSPDAARIAAFHEKPDAIRAQRWVDAGWLWNTGLFVLPVTLLLHEAERHAPRLLAACQRAAASICSDGPFRRLDPVAYAECPTDPIDRAIFEQTDRAAVVRLPAPWSDVGSWAALAERFQADAHGNRIVGDGVLAHCRDTFVFAQHRLVAAAGVDGVVVVETPDAVLVLCPDDPAATEALLEALDTADRPELHDAHEVHRPWGCYQPLAAGARYQAKRIVVRPGEALSLQRHAHRAEHWIVVRGRARVTREETQFELAPNQSTFIPQGALHRLENAGDEPLELIEVQSGDYLGEDDIERFEDRYHRP